MGISRKLMFTIYELVKVRDIGSYYGECFYDDLSYQEEELFTLPDDLKLPDDFDEKKDVPDISYGISRRLYNDKYFLLEIVEALRDFIKSKEFNKETKYYSTSKGDICITDHHYSTPFVCFREEVNNRRGITRHFGC